ncbi:hypothetical protein EI94DRAFT_1812108 [Lactarius quietus]|nr:hypothetical protein EI94DRAFT_1812108 [Lactarius quietus]
MIVRRDGLAIPSKSYDLVLDITQSEDGQKLWSYYYACHETRCLFWLDPYDKPHMISEVKSELFGVKSALHVKHRLESLYWNHWSLFPAVFEGRRLDPAVIDELVGMLSHGCMDVLTSDSSTMPYDAETMQTMLALARNAKKSEAGLVYHIAGVILSFSHTGDFLYFHGQPNARLIKGQTAYTKLYREETILITLLSPMLFSAPEGYLRELEKTCVDGFATQADLINLFIGLMREWERLIVASTVLLSVNIGFLAIPGVVISNLNSNITNTSQVVILTSPAQIASCMSTVVSAGSIVTGLLLIRYTSLNQNAAGTVTYLYQNRHSGLELSSIIFSLPWALLVWA